MTYFRHYIEVRSMYIYIINRSVTHIHSISVSAKRCPHIFSYYQSLWTHKSVNITTTKQQKFKKEHFSLSNIVWDIPWHYAYFNPNVMYYNLPRSQFITLTPVLLLKKKKPNTTYFFGIIPILIMNIIYNIFFQNIYTFFRAEVHPVPRHHLPANLIQRMRKRKRRKKKLLQEDSIEVNNYFWRENLKLYIFN